MLPKIQTDKYPNGEKKSGLDILVERFLALIGFIFLLFILWTLCTSIYREWEKARYIKWQGQCNLALLERLGDSESEKPLPNSFSAEARLQDAQLRYYENENIYRSLGGGK